jgi:cytochrome c
MRHALQQRLTATGALLVALACPLAAQASSQLALDKGCYSCHGARQRGDAPTFERLSSRLQKLRGDEAAQQRWIEKYRAGEPLEHITAHEQLTPEAARALVRWLIDGGQ